MTDKVRALRKKIAKLVDILEQEGIAFTIEVKSEQLHLHSKRSGSGEAKVAIPTPALNEFPHD